ncbi:cytochrome P450 [Agrobacterium rhizogenes]|uniref:cytochrome P450 n=1 Tax=Rhizobium rhizogenes TaxID=359 RepID=UPI001572FEE8|nr:cytochrome P450 [Rhizobium rhizogenes]NTH16722.1 cytochrome P450 [Rhizobium rhizogenes]
MSVAERPAPPPEFNPVSEASFRDPASICQRAREEVPVFFYPPLGVWIVTRHEDVELILTEWTTFSSAANSPEVPAEFRDRFPSSIMADSIVAIDPPRHTEARNVIQRGFAKPKIDPLEAVIEARAHEIIDGFANNGTAEIMNTYCLELTTRTLMALFDLPIEDRKFFEQLRDDSIRILASSYEPMQEPEKSQIWDRYITGHEYFRRLVDERRNSDAKDIVSTMASAVDSKGAPALSAERIALHLVEIAFAGTDTTAQMMANAIIFLNEHPEALAAAKADPALWSRVFEETIRRRPSAPFAGRVTTKDVEMQGITIPAGEPIWTSLVAANTDPRHHKCPMHFDIHRDVPQDHLSFTKGRHTCPGAPLARLQGAVGLRVLFERIPNLRVVPDQPLDFAPLAMLPVRLSMQVTW